MQHICKAFGQIGATMRIAGPNRPRPNLPISRSPIGNRRKSWSLQRTIPGLPSCYLTPRIQPYCDLCADFADARQSRFFGRSRFNSRESQIDRFFGRSQSASITALGLGAERRAPEWPGTCARGESEKTTLVFVRWPPSGSSLHGAPCGVCQSGGGKATIVADRENAKRSCTVQPRPRRAHLTGPPRRTPCRRCCGCIALWTFVCGRVSPSRFRCTVPAAAAPDIHPWRCGHSCTCPAYCIGAGAAD
jgi:hypothetical protein